MERMKPELEELENSLTVMFLNSYQDFNEIATVFVAPLKLFTLTNLNASIVKKSVSLVT